MGIKSLVFIGVFFLFVSCFSQAQAQINANNFGDETMKIMKQGKYILSCNDAKYFAVLAEAAIKDMGTIDKPSQSAKNFENAMSKLEKYLKEFSASKDNDTISEMSEAFDRTSGDLFMLIVAKQSGQAEESEVKEYLNVTFCGAKPAKDAKSINK